jgi:hypothetical protein
MVSGFLTSPWLHERIDSGEATVMPTWSKPFFSDELAKGGFHDHKFRRVGVKKSGGGLELAAR